MRKSMIKSIAITVVLVTMVVAPLTAQIFLQKEKTDISPRSTKADANQEWIIVPVQGMDIDQYAATPLGGGAVVLAGLAGAYAIAKRRKKESK